MFQQQQQQQQFFQQQQPPPQQQFHHHHHNHQQQQQFFQQQPPPQQHYKNDEEFDELKRSFKDVAQTDNGYVVRFVLSQGSTDSYILFVNYLNRNPTYKNAPSVYVHPKGRSSPIIDSESRICNCHLLNNWPSIEKTGCRAIHFIYSIYEFLRDNPPAMNPIEAEFKQMEEKYPELAKMSDTELSALAKNPQQIKSFALGLNDSGNSEMSKLTTEINAITSSIENRLLPEARRAEAAIEAKRREYVTVEAEYNDALKKCGMVKESIDVEGTRAKLNAALDGIDKELRALKETGPCGDLNAYAEKYKTLNMAYYKINLIIKSLG